MLLLDPARLEERRRAVAAGGGLAPLADALAAELAPLQAQGPRIPVEKARMTRYGGRCARDGTLLDFDPWSPRRHRCARCGEAYEGEEHYRWWIVGYQQWLAERAVHASLLHLLRGDAAHAALADAILDGYAERYLAYPNADNVLGPTRPFFSTYLESTWLLQLCVAADLRRAAGAHATVARFLDRVVAPSVAIVREYDEGLSNRQTWNSAALLAAARLMGDDVAAERHAVGPTGVAGHLGQGLLADGSWYEGENYHLFAHRALWYGVTLAGRAGIALPAVGLARFDEGFAVPFLTALPDFTFPARRDAQHKVSLRQWRFAELCELGLARTGDARLRGALRQLYDPAAPEGDAARARSTGETERNAPAARLTRADLGWKSLLYAAERLPAAEVHVPAPTSVLLEGQGLAILRRDAGRVYVSLDYGHTGGGHGHPDRLNLVLHDGATRWLDDVGTGSYTERALHWYRSTLAHNAPIVDGVSQARVDGALVAWEDRGGAGWVEARYDDPYTATILVRTVVVMPDYLVDVLAWQGGAGMVDLPVHADGTLGHVEAWCRGMLAGGDADSDGFAFVSDCEVTYPAAERPVRLDAELGEARASAWFLPQGPAEFWRSVAPGPPGEGPRAFHLVRMANDEGRGALTTVWSWRGAVTDAAVEGDDVVVALADGARHSHRRTAEGWHVDLVAGGARSSIDLAGLRPQVEEAVEPEPGEEAEFDVLAPEQVIEAELVPQLGVPLPFHVGAIVDDLSLPAWRTALGERDWRRTEQAWGEAGRPTARVAMAAEGDYRLVLDLVVRASDPCFAPECSENPLDNEHPDVNSSGLQLYVMAYPSEGPAEGAGWRPVETAWLLVPDRDAPHVRVTVRASSLEAPPTLEAIWAPRPDGWALRVGVPRDWMADSAQVVLGLVVNEMPRGRERRRGQLVLGGAEGEWGYLRGDREDAEHMRLFDIEEPDVPEAEDEGAYDPDDDE